MSVRACGALGRFDPARAESLAAAAGLSAHERHRGPGAILWASPPPVQWAGDDARGFAWGHGVASAAGARGWRSAALAGAAGLVATAGREMVHTSISGVPALYVLQEGPSFYFATRIEPLARIARSLTVDRDAWAAIFTLGYPVGDRTPFLEIRRPGPWTVTSLAAVEDEPWPWRETDPAARGAAPADIARLVGDAISGAGAERAEIPLSGGWDSRLLAALARERLGDAVRCWTTSNDDGRDRDRRYAEAVARELDVPHVYMEGSEEDYWNDAAEVAARSDYQTPVHVWLMPLASRLGEGAGTVFDGLGGDVFLKGLFLTEGMVRAPHPEITARFLWERLSYVSAPGAVLAQGAEIAASARAQLLAVVERFAGHSHEATLSAYVSRTLRGISLAPECLMDPEGGMALPFLSDAVVREALSVHPVRKVGGAFYPPILDAARAGLGALPSTNTHRGGPRPFPRRELSRPAAEGYLKLLSSPAAAQVLAPALRERVADGRVGDLLDGPLASAGGLHAARAAALFALFVQQYGDRLRGL